MLSEDNILRGALVRLTALQPGDVEEMTRDQEDAGFTRMASSDPSYPHTAEANAAYVKKLLDNPKAYVFVIRPVDDDRFIGFINLEDIEWSNGVADLGMSIGRRDNWGKGYGAEALSILLRFAFYELNLHRVGLTVFEYNARAIALYERAGFVREGADREYVHRDGKRFDMIRYGLLRREWEERLSAG
jgi:RimJ/RimL family protein N-acetyltransferase